MFLGYRNWVDYIYPQVKSKFFALNLQMNWIHVVLIGSYSKLILKKVIVLHFFSRPISHQMFHLVVEIRSLDKRPYVIVESPQQDVLDLPKDGLENWNSQDPQMKDFCEDTLFRVKSKIVKRQLYLEPCFKDLDKLN